MKEVQKEIYIENFDKIYQWFQTNVHDNHNEHEYSKIDLTYTHLKLIEVCHKDQPRYTFRVILNATYDVPSKDFKLYKTIDDLKIFSTADVGVKYSYQIFYVQLDISNNPCGGFLFSLKDLSENCYKSMF